mmetsp:Transcript_29520/g.68416  ORF Transcript_29520/g.68416 Transcript_29520/m.68416 type:complete len:264 (-) Transcript_29520:4700-5491(-)
MLLRPRLRQGSGRRGCVKLVRRQSHRFGHELLRSAVSRGRRCASLAARVGGLCLILVPSSGGRVAVARRRLGSRRLGGWGRLGRGGGRITVRLGGGRGTAAVAGDMFGIVVLGVACVRELGQQRACREGGWGRRQGGSQQRLHNEILGAGVPCNHACRLPLVVFRSSVRAGAEECLHDVRSTRTRGDVEWKLSTWCRARHTRARGQKHVGNVSLREVARKMQSREPVASSPHGHVKRVSLQRRRVHPAPLRLQQCGHDVDLPS